MNVSPEEFQRLRALFDRLIDLPASARGPELIGLDDRLRQALEGLLRNASQASTDFLNSPAGASLEDRPMFVPGDVAGGRFRIVERLGAGGMGEVYAAEDLQLHELVAVKTLRQRMVSDPLAVARLRNEVRRARRIGHPHVCRLFEFFEISEPSPVCLITMELLRGRTLRERLAQDGGYAHQEALALLRQISGALQACHDAGIVHRDLKPGNVFLSGEAGTHAVVMDFGICGDYRGGDVSVVGAAGTPAYMAPEQFAGLPATPRTDIYALGILAYEILTGQQLLATASPHAAALGAGSGLGHRLVQPDWRPHLLRCLEKDPERRYPRPGDFVDALAGSRSRNANRRGFLAAAIGGALTAGALWRSLPGRRASALTVGLAPFELSGPGEEFVPAGLADYLSQHLQNQPELRLIGAATMERYKGKGTTIVEIGREVKADYVIRASVSQLTGDIAVSAHLVKVSDGSLAWSKSYRGPKTSLPRLSREIATDVAATLLPRSNSMTLPPTASPDAYDLYLRGRYHFARRDPGDLETAIGLFEKSIATDDQFAPAHSGLSDALCALADVGHTSVRDALDRAHRAASTAVALEPQDGHSHASLALAVSFRVADWKAAESHFKQALSLAPRDATIHQWFSALLLKLGRFDECLDRARQAVVLDPLSLPANVNLANMALLARRYAEAETLFQRVEALAPDFWFVHEALGETYARLDRREDALRHVELALQLGRTRSRALAWAANARAILGERAEALALLAELTAPAANHRFQPFHVARAYAQMGMAKQALDWLERGLAQHDIGLQIVPIHHSFDPIRTDPRFIALSQRLPVPQTSR